jgi:hypothetical protein
MSGSSFSSGAQANPNAYSNMAAQGTPMQPSMMDSLMGDPAGTGAMGRFGTNDPMPGGLPSGSFDIKGPLANMAMGQMMSTLNPQPRPQAPAPQHVMGLQVPKIQQQGPRMYKPHAMGRLYG